MINKASYERIVQEIQSKIDEGQEWLDNFYENPEDEYNAHGNSNVDEMAIEAEARLDGLRLALTLIEDYKDCYPDNHKYNSVSFNEIKDNNSKLNAKSYTWLTKDNLNALCDEMNQEIIENCEDKTYKVGYRQALINIKGSIKGWKE